MATKTYPKSGPISAKAHNTGPTGGSEKYSGPDDFDMAKMDRKYMRDYKKTQR